MYLCLYVDETIAIIARFERAACSALADATKRTVLRLLKCAVAFPRGSKPLLLHAFLVPTLCRAGLLTADWHRPSMHAVGGAALQDEATVSLPGDFVAAVASSCCRVGAYALLVDAVIAAAAGSNAFEVVADTFVRLLRPPQTRRVTGVREVSRSGFAVELDFDTDPDRGGGQFIL